MRGTAHLSISARIISIQYFCSIIILLMLVLTSKSVSLSDGSMLRIAILTAIQGGLFYGSIYVGQVSAGIFLISEHCFFPCRGKWSSNIVCRTEYRNENIFSMYRQHSSGTDAGDGIGASYSRTFRDPALCGLFRIHGTWDPNRSCGFYKGRRVFSEKGRYHYFS